MSFSEEQKRIIALVGAGCTNTEIGEELGYSSDSIKKHLSRLYKRVGVKRRVELVMWIADCHSEERKRAQDLTDSLRNH